MADDASTLALAVTIFEALGVALGGVGTFVVSSRRGRGLADDVAVGVAVGALVGVLAGLGWWIVELVGA